MFNTLNIFKLKGLYKQVKEDNPNLTSDLKAISNDEVDTVTIKLTVEDKDYQVIITRML